MPVNIEKFKECRILVVGDLMIDEYVWGHVDRISPEAPVPVVTVRREEFTLGGAGNVINNLVAMGLQVRAAGMIGTDAHGKQLLSKLWNLRVNTDGIVETMERPTIQKTRIMAGSQHVLRIDRESATTPPPKIAAQVGDAVEAALEESDLMVISDYGKGLLSKSLLERIISAARHKGIISIVDPKGLDYSNYSGATLITPNRQEASLATGVHIMDDGTLLNAGRKLRTRYDIQNVLITRGKDGMTLFSADGKRTDIPAETRQVYDVSGAGDTVVATMAAALAAGEDYVAAASAANTAAGIVVGKVGTATVSGAELRAALSPTARWQDARKMVDLSELADLSDRLRRKGHTIVLTNGCFDLLHAGHLHLFSASREMGDSLIVAIDDDASVKKLKGPGRPVIGERERIRTLCALDSIDHLVVYTNGRLKDVIEAIRPDILTKGSNYDVAAVAGRQEVEQHGGIVKIVPTEQGLSSTNIIERIKNTESMMFDESD